MVVLGVDYGEKRTGVAASDALGILASPVQVLEGVSRKQLPVALAAIAQARGAGKVILGLPLNMNGSKGEKALQCEALAERLREELQLPVLLWDERLTTVSAHKALNEVNVRGAKRKQIVDAVAAVMILQSYLDQKGARE
ncbi:MAG: Holliday junction resolvase RuvX [Oscillospiraceae bacterium]|jgi:putative Holliday junction resolvase|nr:Holliday junction resolvase RuvX [Oscillospiraceae bacterium]